MNSTPTSLSETAHSTLRNAASVTREFTMTRKKFNTSVVNSFASSEIRWSGLSTLSELRMR
jgi:hypothetical protein